MTYDIAIVGPGAVISGFKALGVHAYGAETGDEAVSIIRDMKKDLETGNAKKVGIVILIESIASHISPEDMERISRGALPAIVVLPGIEGSQGASVAKLKTLAEKAIGSDIFGN